MTPARLLAPLLVLALATLAAPADARPPEPVLWQDSVGDPAVAAVGDGYVVVGTGRRLVRATSPTGRRWRFTDAPLTRLPSWARRRGDVWAAELVRLRGRWVLYFAAPVRGLGETGRCIGVAVSDRALGRFRPVGGRPLVCPARARTPTAMDPVTAAAAGVPLHGAIDPSVLVEDGQVHLLYKTDGLPSSIRLVRLRRDGLAVAGGETSRTLLTSPRVVENPAVVRRPEGYYLFLSAGDYSRCSYHTVWLRSPTLHDWTAATPQRLLDRPGTGLCGPGGADPVVEGRRTTLFFHGWVCRRSTRPCRAPFWLREPGGRRPVRALYAARLTFAGGQPSVRRYLG